MKTKTQYDHNPYRRNMNWRLTYQPTLRLAGVLLLALVSVSVLTGCLVKKKDLEQIARKTDNLRVYQPGDTIYYDVSGLRDPNDPLLFPVPISGTLTIKWSTPTSALIRPGTSTIIQALKEEATLNINGSEVKTIRYISQNTDGQITLHALEDTLGERYWLNTAGVTTPVQGSATIDVVTFLSHAPPIGIEFEDMGPISFEVMGDCVSPDTECDLHAGTYTDVRFEVVGDSEPITNKLGEFLNPFRIDYFGSTTPGSNPLPLYFDIRDACSNSGTVISHGIPQGSMFIMPEIGMIEMRNTCQDSELSGDTIHYTVKLRSVSFILPW